MLFLILKHKTGFFAMQNACGMKSELSMLAQDETKTDAQTVLCVVKSFNQAYDFVTAIKAKDFNGISLFQGTTVSAVILIQGQQWVGPVLHSTGGYWTSVASSDVTSSAMHPQLSLM